MAGLIFLTMIFLMVSCLVGVSVQSDLSLMYKTVTKGSRCVTNSSSALSWVGTDITENDVFLPPPQNDSYLDILQNVEEPWIVQTSLQGNISKVILDRRWEELKLHTTPPNIIVSSNLTEEFTIPFSLRVKNEAHIYLCDEDVIQNANCYWFLLQAYGGRKSATRECKKEKKSTIQENNCFIDLNVKYHPEDYQSYLSEEVWSHFILEKKEHFRLYQGENILLNFEVQDPINVKYMIISSKDTVGFWKIHETEYIYTDQELNTTQLGPVIETVDGSVCVSMFVVMCDSCSLKLTLATSSEQVLHEQTFGSKKSEWEEIKIFVSNVESPEVVLLVSTINIKENSPFWAVDKLRQCQKDEYRMISSSKQASCHLIKDNKQSVQMSFNEVKELSQYTCSEKFVDRFCSTCFWLLDDKGNCTQAATCSKRKNSLTCSCSSGFYSSEDCIYMCIERQNGTSCGRKCENECTGNCSSSGGTCKKCRNLYNGPGCSIKAGSIPLKQVLPGTIAVIVAFCIGFVVVLYVSKRIRSKRLIENAGSDVLADDQFNLAIRHLETINKAYNSLKPIEITQFYDYVKTGFSNNEIESQCLAILKNMSRMSYAEITSNMVLDYVDMYYSDSTRIPKAYIVTIFPKNQQYDDFWKLVWEENVKTIVLFDNEHATNESKYWPDKNVMGFRNLSVQPLSKKTCVDYEHRKLLLTYKNSMRQVDLYRLTSWLDGGVPSSTQTFVSFFQKVSKIPLSQESPLLVQCRFSPVAAAFFLLCDINLRTANKNGVVDFHKTFDRLVENTMNLVSEDSGYYLLAHLIVADCFLAIDTTMTYNSFTKAKINEHVAYLQKTLWIDSTMRKIKRENDVYFRVTSPSDGGRLKLVSYSPEQLYHSYMDTLNAIHLDGLASPNKFIVTTEPTNGTVETFWSMIETRNVSTIVLFSEFNQPSKCWPSENYPEVHPSKFVTLKHITTDQWKSWNQISLELHSTISRGRTIKILMFKKWFKKSSCPQSVADFVKFCTMSEDCLKETSPVVIASYDGVTASGLYLAMLYTMNKMMLETICDVCISVRMIRSYNDTFLQKMEQLYFLYDAAKVYFEDNVKNKKK